VTGAIEPFEIRVEDAVLEDLRDRLARTRFPDQIDGTGWEYGLPVEYLRELVQYWRDVYDWRAAEARLNRFEHFRTEIDGQSIHFVHARSPHADAMPLLLTHGWPGSIAEFLDVIPRLTAPEAHGGRAEDAFHVVAPSLPGYGFSEPTRTRGWDTWRVARAFTELMQRLGYTRYGAQGGDWGAQVSTRIGLVDPEHCAAIHLNMPIGERPKDASTPLSEEDQATLAAMAHFQREESGYANEQATKPQTLGAALNDSPAGLLAWIVEKFRTWSDCDGDVERRFTKDRMLTNIMLYWVTATGHSAGRLYYEATKAGRFGPQGARVEVPTGAAVFPREIVRPPRRWAEHSYNITHWTEMPSGGHFAAMEEPGLLVDDVRAFFSTVR
jgi:pimeloyl-ACP methyl ester carboxylesterase